MKIKKIGIFTSGGDAPGMNAAIRSVVRTSIYNKIKVTGIIGGFKGFVNGEYRELLASNVSGIIQKGGTILKTANSEEFKTAYGRKMAYDNLKKNNIDAVIAIGGDGTMSALNIFINEYDIPFIAIPATINNDVSHTDYTIGFDTALNTIVSAVDKIRDTASSHERVFFIEIMGKETGYLAQTSGISCGAEAILIPEIKNQLPGLLSFLHNNPERNASIVLVAEGEDEGGALVIANKVKREIPSLDVRVTILGHIQRGGTPTCQDRLVASRMGLAAIEALLQDEKNIMIGLQNNKIVHIPLKEIVRKSKDISNEYRQLSTILI